MEAIYEDSEVKIIEEVESCYTLMEVSSPRKKKKIKGNGDHTVKFKKPRSAYLLYYFDVHQSIQQEHPDMPQSEINKRISDSWKRLNVADRGFYLERAKMEKEGLDPNTQSAGSSQDVPGFRKILPRANYMLVPNGSVGEEVFGSPVEVCMEAGLDPQGEGLLCEGSQTQETLISSGALGSEVEMTEQCIAIKGLSEETTVTLGRSGVLQGILSPHSSNTSPSQIHVHEPMASGKPGKEQEVRHVVEPYSGVGMVMEAGLESRPVMQQVKAAGSHLVAILPSQELLENKLIPAASSIMMVPVMNNVKPEPKPSFKLPIKYTRRGRGSCSTPGCFFTYVTRHKPPHCPDCGQHLGGKWVASTKRVPDKAVPGSTPSPKKQPKCLNGNSESCAPHGETKCQEAMETERESPDTPVQDRAASPALELHGGASSPVRTGRPRRSSVSQCATQDGAVSKDPASTCSARNEAKATVVGRARALSKEKSSGSLRKRRIRAILPAPLNPPPACPAIVQWIAVPSEVKGHSKPKNRTGKPISDQISGLKPSTLKQLGHTVPPPASELKPPTPANNNQFIITENGVKVMSLVPLRHNSGSSLELGLSTSRGRGRCKNPSCSYVYKNRHKPQHCPSCGWELTKKPAKKPKQPTDGEEPEALLNPQQALSGAQRDVQRQCTLQLLRRCLQIPESEAELQEVLSLVQELNGTQEPSGHRTEGEGGREEERGEEGEETTGPQHQGWPSFYEPAATHCALCHYPLFKGERGTVAGPEDCWLLTDSGIHAVVVQLKVCMNLRCLALHSFVDLHPGLFNVGNKLLVSLDLFFKIRSRIRLGHDPAEASLGILNNIQRRPEDMLSSEELTHVQELLCNGYWAFECLTMRDYNDMICGVCGIAPKLEIAQRNVNNVLQLKNVEFTWPDFQASDEVHVDEFWLTMENEALEQAVFPSSIPITRFDASIIAPFFPPLMRNTVVINTEKDKIITDKPLRGDPSMLVRLIHEGQLRPEEIDQHTEEELRQVLESCGIPPGPHSTKDELLVLVCLLYTHVQNGLTTAPPPPDHLTAGKLSKICPHQVVCGSKYMVRRESSRDHVDLLVSSRFWPPVYVTDCAQKVALCTDVQYPELASQMWGRNQGCFSDPRGKAEYVSCVELQDQQYSVDLSAVDSSQVHPVTKSSACWIVHSGRTGENHDDPPPGLHHSMALCKELAPYVSLVAELEEDAEEEKTDECSVTATSVRRKAVTFDNAAYYYLYNRLVDFLSSRDIVSQQIMEVLRVCQPGEVVIRDALYRLGVAQLNTEQEEEGEVEGDADPVGEEVVLE